MKVSLKAVFQILSSGLRWYSQVQESAGDFRVTYREAPGDMASHNICVEGMFNEATKAGKENG